MMHHKYMSLSCGMLLAIGAGAAPVEEAALGESVERNLSSDEAIEQWTKDPALIKWERGDVIVATQTTKEEIETVKLQNVIPAIRFESGVAAIPPGYVESLRKVL